MRLIHILETPDFKAGDPMPRNAGYLASHAWADAQIEAGLNQSECGKCGKSWFPQDLSDQTHSYELTDSKGNKVAITAPICNDCVKNGTRSE